jgi:hypothetical protein
MTESDWRLSLPDASVRTFDLRDMRRYCVLPPSTHAGRPVANLVAVGDDRDMPVAVDDHVRIGRQVVRRPLPTADEGSWVRTHVINR